MRAITYTAAREGLAATMDEVCRDRAQPLLRAGRGQLRQEFVHGGEVARRRLGVPLVPHAPYRTRASPGSQAAALPQPRGFC